MLLTRYETNRDFCAIVQFIEGMDEELAAIDKLLSDKKLFQLLKADLSQRYPQTTKTGRNSTPVPQTVEKFKRSGNASRFVELLLQAHQENRLLDPRELIDD